MLSENIDLQKLDRMVVELRERSGVITVERDVQPDGTYLLFEGEHFPRAIMDLLRLKNINPVDVHAEVNDEHKPIIVAKFQVLKL